MRVKKCTKCGIEKPVSDFYRDAHRKDGLFSWCKSCWSVKTKAKYAANREQAVAQSKAWKQANPERVRQYQRDYYARNREAFAGYRRRYIERDPERWRRREKNWKLLRAYGLTIEQYEAMVEVQQGVCAICRQPPAEGKILVVDHCHTSGCIRALLCDTCNLLIGTAGDDPEWFKRAAGYLRKHQAST
jgi:hypothetical protein